MPRIFVSYRRADSITITGRIYDHLVRAFGEDLVFKDVDDIPLGADFRGVLQNAVGRCDVLLVIIGPEWLRLTNEQGQRRIFDPDDFVHVEVAAGLVRRDVLVVPVLVNGAAMPGSADLPPALTELAYRNAAIVRDDPDFARDMGRLIEQVTSQTTPATAPPVRVAPAGGAPSESPARQKPATARPPVTRQPAPAPAPRHTGRWLLAILVIVVIGAGAVWALNNLDAIKGFYLGGAPPLDMGSAEEAPAGSLICDVPEGGAITNEDWQDTWQFEGQAGQPVMITMRRVPNAGDLDPVLMLRMPDGSELAADDDQGGEHDARLLAWLPVSGVYTVGAARFDLDAGQTLGRYELSVDCALKILVCGEEVEGFVSPDRPVERWGFYVDGDISITALLYLQPETQGPPPQVGLELAGPNDEIVAISEPVDDLTALLPFRAERAGVYTLMVQYQGAGPQQQVAAPGTAYVVTLGCE